MKTCGACPHPKAAHGPQEDDGCRFGGCLCGGFVAEPRTRGPNIPVLTIPPETGAGLRVTIGIPDMLFDGEPFPWATIGTWTLSFNQDDVAILTVSLPVAIGENVQPAAEPVPEAVGV